MPVCWTLILVSRLPASYASPTPSTSQSSHSWMSLGSSPVPTKSSEESSATEQSSSTHMLRPPSPRSLSSPARPMAVRTMSCLPSTCVATPTTHGPPLRSPSWVPRVPARSSTVTNLRRSLSRRPVNTKPPSATQQRQVVVVSLMGLSFLVRHASGFVRIWTASSPSRSATHGASTATSRYKEKQQK
eukprot:PhF_6_TR33643/c2_g1_i1/m.49190